MAVCFASQFQLCRTECSLSKYLYKISTGHMSVPSSPSNPPSSTPAISDADLEKLLSREASAFQRELEVERILKAFKLKCACRLI